MITSFFIGFIVPLAARRLIKIFPEDAGTALAYLLCPRKTKIYQNSKHSKKWLSLYFKYIALSLFYGAVSVCSLYFLTDNFTENYFWMTSFVWMLLVLGEIDKRVMLLPDVLTVPLLLFGFAFACFSDMIPPEQSAIGALFGYFIPVISSCLVSFFKKDTIGGGDIKILAGLGAWLGLQYLGLAILISFVFFTIGAIIRKNRTGPYGPAIITASIIAIYLKNIDFLEPYFEFMTRY